MSSPKSSPSVKFSPSGRVSPLLAHLPHIEPTFYEFAEVKPRRQVFSFGSCFSSPGRTFHTSSPPPGSPTRRCGESGNPRSSFLAYPLPLSSHASSRPLQCLSSSRAGGFVRCATSSGRHDLLSVLIILHDQQHIYSLRLPTLEARTGERTHLTHGPLPGSPARSFGRSRQPCPLVIHYRGLLWFSLSRLFRL